MWSKQMGKKIGPHVVGAKLELYAVLISDHANGDNNGFGNVVSIPSRVINMPQMVTKIYQ